MPKRLRTALWTVFLIGFALAAPAVVLYTAGYRYNTLSGRVVETGLLSVASLPRGADVLVDGQRTGDRTPALIAEVQAGTHAVRLERAGYLPWEKRFRVEDRQTTFAEEAVLYLDAAPQLLASRAPLAAAADHARERLAVAVPSAEEGSADILLVASAKEPALLATVAYDGGDVALAWSPADQWIDAQVGAERVLIRADETSLRSRPAIRLSELVPGARRLDWGYGDLTLTAATRTWKRDISLPDGGLGAVQNDADAALAHGNGAYTARALESGTVVAYEPTGAPSTILAYLPAGDYRFDPQRDGLLVLSDDERDRLVLIDQGAAAQNEEPILLNVRATDWQWEAGGDRLLYTDGFELHIYHVGTHTDQTLTRVGTPITGIAWHPNGKAVLYAQPGEVASVELDARDGHLLTPLATGAHLGALALFDPGRGYDLLLAGTVGEEAGIWMRPLQDR